MKKYYSHMALENVHDLAEELAHAGYDTENEPAFIIRKMRVLAEGIACDLGCRPIRCRDGWQRRRPALKTWRRNP